MKSQSGKQLNHIAESLPRQLKSLSLNSQLPQGKWFPPHITAESPILGPQVPTPEPSHDSACKDLDPLIVEELESDFCKSLPIPSSPQQSRNSGPTNTPQCVTSISDANTQDILHDLSDAPFIAADYDGQTVEIVIHRPSSRPVPGLSEHKFALNTTVEVAHTLYSSVQLVECKRTSVSQSEPLHSSFNELVWWEWVQNGSALQASLPAVSIIARGQRADWTLPSDLEGLDIPDGTKIEPRLHYAANDTRLSDLHYVYDH